MRRADVIKLSFIFFLIFILCLLEFLPQETQVQFLCETVDPCTPKNGSGDVLVCGQANLPCPTEIINGSSQDEPTDWYVCKREMDSEVLHDNTSVSGEHVMVVHTLKGYNLSEWNVSVFTFLNHTDLYTGPQDYQRHFYCLLPPNKSKCPDITEEPPKENFNRPITFQLTTTASPKPVTSSLKKTILSSKEMSYTQKLNCQPGSNHFIHYQENSSFPRMQTKKGLESWWCVTTAVWFFLVLILLIVALTSVSDRISKSRRIHKKKSNLVVVSPRDYQLTEINEHRGNSRNSASDVFVTVCSGENGNPRKVNVPFKRPLSPINEITENSLDEDHEEEEEQRSLVTKQAHLHHRSNPSRSCHGTDGEL
nr:uncharacterized protein si:dkey-192k22.2 isoform X3 [Misgurnus anguillicaudatus]XP_055061622.1 uncharacterized protein si:dkey-192k22.2 isoform X3 [Misgurnus anguillicaudatus]